MRLEGLGHHPLLAHAARMADAGEEPLITEDDHLVFDEAAIGMGLVGGQLDHVDPQLPEGGHIGGVLFLGALHIGFALPEEPAEGRLEAPRDAPHQGPSSLAGKNARHHHLPGTKDRSHPVDGRGFRPWRAPGLDWDHVLPESTPMPQPGLRGSPGPREGRGPGRALALHGLRRGLYAPGPRPRLREGHGSMDRPGGGSRGRRLPHGGHLAAGGGRGGGCAGPVGHRPHHSPATFSPVGPVSPLARRRVGGHTLLALAFASSIVLIGCACGRTASPEPATHSGVAPMEFLILLT